jgi:hypothetical protein
MPIMGSNLLNSLGFAHYVSFYIRILWTRGLNCIALFYKCTNPNGFIGFEPIIL